MVALGFELKKGELRITSLEGTLQAPAYVRHERRVFNPDLSRPELMNWFRQNFLEILNQQRPTSLSYRVSLAANSVDQMAYLHFPWGLLGLVSFDKGIRVVELNDRSYTAKRFGLPKGSNVENSLIALIGNHPPHWDSSQIKSALSEWAAL